MPENSDSSPKKAKVLDLLDTTKKPSRRERQRKEAEVIPPAPSALDEKKANALDLFADDKKSKIRKTSRTGKAVLGTISKILDKEEEKTPIIIEEPQTTLEAEALSASPVVEPEPEKVIDDPKLIVIKPPILIPDLAARLGLKPFNIMADLIKIGVFPAPTNRLSRTSLRKSAKSTALRSSAKSATRTRAFTKSRRSSPSLKHLRRSLRTC